jgi:predicted PurR-regulated permease PerM
MHGAVIFFALLGGLAAFGPVGLVVGPLVVAFILALTGTRGVPTASER